MGIRAGFSRKGPLNCLLKYTKFTIRNERYSTEKTGSFQSPSTKKWKTQSKDKESLQTSKDTSFSLDTQQHLNKTTPTSIYYSRSILLEMKDPISLQMLQNNKT